MSDVSHFDLGRRARRLRVDTLVRLRWLAIVGQSIAILVTYYGLGFALPIGYCFLVIATSAWLNIGLRLRYRVSDRLDDYASFALLTYDVLQLSVLLYLNGGLENPFAILYLAPIMASAVSLSRHWTAWLMLVMVVAASALVFRHMALPWYREDMLTLPFLYVAGIWVAIVLGAGFIAVYASRVAEESRQLADALAATELVLAREQHLTQLDGLAAAAAHELGTPLATITLVVKELAKLAPVSGAVADDIALITQEVQRCRSILSKITSLGDGGDGMFDVMALGHLLEEVVQPQRDFGVDVRVTASGPPPEPRCRRNPGILYGLGNLVENAIDFAKSEVRIKSEWTEAIVTITIEDDGPGFSPDVLNRLGEPYVTSRGGPRRAKSEADFGLGLGLFIAKTLLERSGAVVNPKNAGLPESGARVAIQWPRPIFERGLHDGDNARARA